MSAHAKLCTSWRSWIPIIIIFNHGRYRILWVWDRISPFPSRRCRPSFSESHLMWPEFESVSFLLVTSFLATWLPWPSLWLDMADGTLEIFLFFYALLSIGYLYMYDYTNILDLNICVYLYTQFYLKLVNIHLGLSQKYFLEIYGESYRCTWENFGLGTT